MLKTFLGRGALLCACLAISGRVLAALAGYSEYIIPGDEEMMHSILDEIGANDQNFPNANNHSYITITAWSDNTIVYYDHWEDGYDFDFDDPAGTADQVITLANRGDSYVFEGTDIPTNPRGTATYYDGRDRIIVAGGAATCSRASWTESAGTLLAVAWEVYPIRPQLTTYIIPFGEDLVASGLLDFDRVYALIQATADGTVVQVDFDGDGTYDALDQNRDGDTADPGDDNTIELDKGEVFRLDNYSGGPGITSLDTGTIIQGNETLQVHYIIGDQGSNYEVRGLAAFPRGYWDDEYYAPVDGSTGGENVDVYLYNPHASTLTINWETSFGNGSFTINAKSTRSFQEATGSYVPDGTSLYLGGSDEFWGISTIDAENTGSDWAYSLVPAFLLENEHFMGWAPGAYQVGDPPGAGDPDNNSDSDSGIFICPAQDNIRVFVDYDNDGVVDDTYDLDRLQTQYIYDDDGDMSEAHIYATGPYSAAYGQNPDLATPYAPAIDVGYTTLPAHDFVDLVLTVEKSADPTMVPTGIGEQSTFTFVVNSYDYDVDDISVVDTLPTGWQYVAGSTAIVLADKTTSTADPVISGSDLTWSDTVLGDLAPNQEITITFTAETTASSTPGAISRNEVVASGTRVVNGATQTFNATDFVFITYGDHEMTKTSSGSDPLGPGDTYTYTVTVSNPSGGSVTLTDVAIYDPLPDGIGYDTGTSSLTITTLTPDVADDFSGGQVYTNNSGVQNWSGAWSETDNGGGGASGGDVQIPSGEEYLQIRGVASGSNAIQRELDLSSATAATLTLSYTPTAAVAGTDELILSISSNGGGSWTELTRFSDSSSSYNTSVDAYMAGNTVIKLATDTSDFVSSGGDVADNFGSQLYSNNDGSANWTDNWTETNDDGSATAGYIQVRGGTDNDLQITGRSGSVSIERSKDLSGQTNATLSLDYTPSASVDAADELILEVAPDGSTWTELTRFSNSSSSYSTDISAYIGSDTTIRLTTDTGDFTETGNAATDDFATKDWTGGTGWTGNWVEDGDDGNPDTGTVRAKPGYLLLWNSGTPAVARRADLSSYASADSVTLTFDLSHKKAEFNDTLYVQVASDAAAGTPITGTWNTIGSYTPASAGSNSVTIDASYLVSTFGLRFTTSTLSSQDEIRVDNIVISYAQGEPAYVDNVSISYEAVKAAQIDDVKVTYSVASPVTAIGPTAAGTDPDFVEASDGYNLLPGDTLTLTFDVTVDDPVPTGLAEITNTAYLTSNEFFVPLSDDATNTVSIPSAASAIVGDIVFFDEDGDGVFDVSESGLSNVEVTLKDQFGTPVAVTTTDINGEYSFTGVEPGNGYYVKVTDGIPYGLTQSAPIGHSDDQTEPFDLVAGQNYQDADLGYAPDPATATLGDRVWLDADEDKLQDPGEVGMEGITVALYQDDGDGEFEPTVAEQVGLTIDTLVTTTTTAADGTYLFLGVTVADDYWIWIDTTQAALTGPDPDYVPTDVATYEVTGLIAGDVLREFDFGFSGGETYSVTDKIWYDVNEDEADDGEDGIGGVTVELLNATGTAIAATTTAADGTFTFSGLEGNGADYTIRITDTDARLADYFGTTAEAAAGEIAIDNLDEDRDYTSGGQEPNFGYALKGTVGGTVFNDIDGVGTDGVQDASEPGISGVTVNLYLDGGDPTEFDPGAADTLVATTTTNADGEYLFSGLADGTYWVHIDEMQATLVDFNDSGNPRPAEDDNAPADAGHQREATIAGGGTDLGLDYGYRVGTAYFISGIVWNDEDGDGLDNDTAGYEGVTVRLVKDGVVVETVSTDANGAYSFAGLPAGNYEVQITDGAGILDGLDTTFELTEGVLAGSYDDLEAFPGLGADVTDLYFRYHDALALLVAVQSFSATTEDGVVVIEWRTAAEVGTAGFHLERQAEDGTYARVNAELLPSLFTAPLGGIYRFADHGAVPGQAAVYRLLEVEIRGKVRVYGPFTVAPPAASKRGQTLIRSTMAADSAESDGYTRAVRLPRTAAPADNTGRGQRITIDGPLKLGIGDAGMYCVSSDAIATALGITPTEASQIIAALQLRLSHRGNDVAYLPAVGGTSLYFYAESISTLSTSENVYWLDVAGTRVPPGTRMAYASAAPRTAAAATAFDWTYTFEEDESPMTDQSDDPGEDYWVWTVAYAGSTAADTPFRTDGAAGTGTAGMALRLRGATDTAAAADHHVRISVNGTQVAEDTWDGTDWRDITCEFDAGLLNDGDNTLTITALRDPGVPYSIVALESFSVSCQRRFVAANNALVVPGGAAGRTLTIDGFTTPAIDVFDISDPLVPVQLTGCRRARTASGYQVSFRTTAADRTYMAAALGAAAAPTISVAEDWAYLTNAENNVDYLVVCPTNFVETAQTLADHRQANGLDAMVADLDAIMNAFNDGIYDLEAIRTFLTWARTNWATAPRYVVLAGSGTYDYRDIWGAGGCLIPVPLTNTGEGLFASDHYYADVVGDDGVPDLAIGRLPARTADELETMIAKVVAYESGSNHLESWQEKVTFLADDPDAGGNFPQDSDSVAALLPKSYDGTRIYLSELPAAEARTQLFAKLANGTVWVNFFGHGTPQIFAAEELLTVADVPSLDNAERLPIFSAVTCLAGNSAIPGYESLSATLVRAGNGGAIAVWSTSGLSSSDNDTYLSRELFRSVFVKDAKRLGDAMLGAMSRYYATDRQAHIPRIYNLMGDPALELPTK